MLTHKTLIDKLTPAQRVRILTGAATLGGKDMKILGIPGVKVGKMKDYGRGLYPHITSLASAFDRDLWGEIAAHQATAMQRDGVGLFLLGGPKIKLSPFRREVSEDPYLASAVAATRLSALTDRGLTAAATGYYLTESDVAFLDAQPQEDVMQEFLVRPFRHAIAEGGGAGVVVDPRIPNEAYRELCRRLPEELGEVAGFRVCEKATGENTVALLARGVICLEGSANALEAAISQYRRLKQEGNEEELAEALAAGTAISDEAVEEALDRTLTFLFTCGKVTSVPEEPTDEEALAMRATLASAVLIKNTDRILPLSPELRIGLIGGLAYPDEGEGDLAECARIALTERGYTCTGAVRGYDTERISNDHYCDRALRLADSSDVVILFLGFGYENEKRIPKTATLNLPANQLYLADKLTSQGKRLIAVVASGHAPDIEFTRHFDAVLYMPLEVTSSAEAAVRLLIGEENPAGRLSYTLYAGSEKAFEKQAFYRAEQGIKAGPFIGYRYYDTAGMRLGYPFGHGLSYTYFRYSRLRVANGSVTLRLTNYGERAGEEVVQVYLGLDRSAVLRPRKELCGFLRVALAAGESKTVTIPFTPPPLCRGGKDAVEAGRYTVYVGASVTDIRLVGRLRLPGETPPHESFRLSDYLQSVSNVTEGNYTLEAKYRPMKNTIKNILFGVGFLALAICLAVFNSTTESFSMLLGVISGILAATALIFFIVEGVERSRLQAYERRLVDALNKNHFEEAEEIAVPSTAKMFREEFDLLENEALEVQKPTETEDESIAEFIDPNHRAAEAAEELKAFLTGHGMLPDPELPEAWLASVATSRLLLLPATPAEVFNPFLRLLSEYFGAESFVDAAVADTDTENALFSYDYHGDHTKKNLLRALEYAKNNPTKAVFAAIGEATAEQLTALLTPFMKYLHTPKAKNAIQLANENGAAMAYEIPANLRLVIALATGEAMTALPASILALATVNRIAVAPCPTEEAAPSVRPFSRHQLDYMIDKEAKKQAIPEELFKKIDRLERYVTEHSEYRIGNKQWLGLENHLGFLLACGMAENDATDVTLATRLLPVMATALRGNLAADDPSLNETLEFIFGEENVARSKEFLALLEVAAEEAPAEEAPAEEAPAEEAPAEEAPAEEAPAEEAPAEEAPAEEAPAEGNAEGNEEGAEEQPFTPPTEFDVEIPIIEDTDEKKEPPTDDAI